MVMHFKWVCVISVYQYFSNVEVRLFFTASIINKTKVNIWKAKIQLNSGQKLIIYFEKQTRWICFNICLPIFYT